MKKREFALIFTRALRPLRKTSRSFAVNKVDLTAKEREVLAPSSAKFTEIDGFTRLLIPNSGYFTYNLRRLRTERYFSVKFDLTKEIPKPSAPWG